MEAKELTKVGELQETLVEDSEPGQHDRGKQAAGDLGSGHASEKEDKKGCHVDGASDWAKSNGRHGWRCT